MLYVLDIVLGVLGVSKHFLISLKEPLIKGQRCVILADGFYEWMRQEKDKQPFFIYFPQTQGLGEKKTEVQDDLMTSAGNEKNSETMCPPKASPDLREVCFGFSIAL